MSENRPRVDKLIIARVGTTPIFVQVLTPWYKYEGNISHVVSYTLELGVCFSPSRRPPVPIPYVSQYTIYRRYDG